MSNDRCQMIDDKSSFPRFQEDGSQQTDMSVLLSFEDGFAFLKERARPFAHIFGRKQARE